MKSKMLKIVIVGLALATFCLTGCGSSGTDAESSNETPGGAGLQDSGNITVFDSEGNEYPTVKIQGQIWMAKNMNANVEGSYCFDDDPANCEKYGRLYPWKIAMRMCPEGWHLPSLAAFRDLARYYEPSSASLILRASEWGNGSDLYGFTALPGGYFNSRDQKFISMDFLAYFWSSTTGIFNEEEAAYFKIGNNGDKNDIEGDGFSKMNALSVRCLRNANPFVAALYVGEVSDADGNVYPTVKIGKQVWTAKNMNVEKAGSYCYDNDPANCEKYGRLYSGNWLENVCPAGWHLPSKEEYEVLLENIASSDGLQWQDLKSGEWDEGNDKYGFSILPAGNFFASAGEFRELGYSAHFWTSSRTEDGYVYFMGPGVGSVTGSDARNGFSVRCLKD